MLSGSGERGEGVSAIKQGRVEGKEIVLNACMYLAPQIVSDINYKETLRLLPTTFVLRLMKKMFCTCIMSLWVVCLII